MRFALLGIDQQGLLLAQAVARSDAHDSVLFLEDGATCEGYGANLESIGSVAYPLDADGQWLEHLARADVAAAIVAYASDAAAVIERIKGAAALGLPVVLLHPVNLSAMAYYEMELLGDQSGGWLIPFVCAQAHPAFKEIQQQVDSAQTQATVMPTERMDIERSASRADPKFLLRFFAQDTALIEAIVGKVSGVSGMVSSDATAMRLPWTVQLSGPHGVPVRWLARLESVDRLRMVVESKASKLELELGADASGQLLVAREGEAPETFNFTAEQGADAYLTSIVDRITQTVEKPSMPRSAVHTIELTEALERSIRKGRIVSLDNQPRGEKDAFKGTMASLGCALLLGGLFLLILSALAIKFAKIQGLDGLAAAIAKVPYLLLGVLCLFLLLQLLRFVIPAKEDKGSD